LVVGETHIQITEEELIGLLDQISAEETKKKETKIVVTFLSHAAY
jgi:DNA-binding TFAR19-related protein (PDSD5 family)